jgi:Flp pilus assembly protein TadD
MADRYTYIPQIGLFIVMVWGFYDVSLSWRPLQRWLPTLATAAVLVLSLLTWRQAGYWSDSITLGKHTIATTGPNVVFESELGVGLMNRGLNDEAEAHFRKAIAIQPANPQPHGNLGTLLLRANRLDEAIQEYLVLLKLNPDDPRAHSQLGTIYTMQKKLEEAEKEFREAVRITPTSYEAHHNLALTLQSRGKTAEAIEQYHETLRLRPEFPSGLNNFAWVLATHPDAKYRNGAEAVALVQRALAIVPQEADYLDTLAVAQAEIGQFDEATKTIEKALVLAQKLNRSDFAKDLEKRRDLFRRRQPYRDPSLMGP